MMKQLSGGLATATLVLLAGCAGFFVDTHSSATAAGSTSGDYVYIVNQITNTLSEFSLASSALTPITGSPVSLSAVTAAGSAASVAVSRQNAFVYVGGQGGIGCFSIGNGGALTAVSANTLTSTGDFVSLDTSPDGKWLIALDGVLHSVNVYAINTSTGALTPTSSVAYPATLGGNPSVAQAVRISPNAAFIAVALGTAGDAIFGFTTSSGLIGTGYSALQFTQQGTNSSDNAVVFDAASAYFYVGRTVSGSGNSILASYSLSSSGLISAGQTVPSGDAPFGLLVDSTGKYLYSANRGSANVSGYAITNGVFTALAGAPYPSGLTATALVEDNSNKYIIGAAQGGSSDFTLYSFDALTAGKLDAVAVGVSGTDAAGSNAVAATH